MSSGGQYGEIPNDEMGKQLDALGKEVEEMLKDVAKDGMKFSHLRDDGYYCGTITFVPDEKNDVVRYGISIASYNEKRITYERGKNIAIARCLSGCDLEWADYHGNDINTRIITLKLVGLEKAGTLPASQFFESLRKLRKYM
jgi:hypothetical protein